MPSKTASKKAKSPASEFGDPAEARRRRLEAIEIAPYDFRRPHRISKERLRTLEAMYERLVKSLEGWMMGRLRGGIELSLKEVEQLGFADFTNGVSTPCCSYLIDIRDSGGQLGVIDFTNELAFFLVDRLLGGRGGGAAPQRTMTPIERMIVRTVAERISGGVREVWADYIPLELDVAGFESVPEMLRASSDDAPVLVARIDARIGETTTQISICLPFGVLDTFFADTGAQRRPGTTGSNVEQRVNRKVVEGSLRVTTLPVAARLPEFRISMRELSSLQEGSMLTTGLSRHSDIEVLVGGTPRFRGRPARVGRRLAVNVTEAFAENESAEGQGNGLKLFDEGE